MTSRRIADLHLELARVHTALAEALASTERGDDWIDQDGSPLGRRRHLELARTGVVKCSRVGRSVLVRRSDIDAYLASRAVVVVDEAADEEREIARVVGMIGRNRKGAR